MNHSTLAHMVLIFGISAVMRAEQPERKNSNTRSPSSSGSPRTLSAPSPGIGNKFKLEGGRWTFKDGDFEMSGIFLKPEGRGPFPAVLISHGMGGNAEGFGMQKAREMVKWGFVCMAPNYTHQASALAGMGKGTGKAANTTFGASAENIRRARTCFEILRGMPGVDAKRFTAYGHSMGGFVTIGLAASFPDLLKAAAITGSGVSPREGYAAPSEASAEKIRTPFLMLHGSNDTTVRPDQSAALKQILDRNKVPNDRLLADGQAHPIDQTMREEVFRLVHEWFQKYARNLK